MELRGPDDAATRHLEGVAADILGLLGPGVDLDELVEVQSPQTVTLRARYRLAGVPGESSGSGENVVEAHALLRAALVVDRLALGLRILT